MKLLLRLYPRAWRDRYEDEFLGTVEDRDLSLGDTVDIILRAIDARLNDWGRRAPGEVLQPAAHGASPARLAASLLMIAGVLLLAPPIVTHVAILPVSAQIPNLIGLLRARAARHDLW